MFIFQNREDAISLIMEAIAIYEKTNKDKNSVLVTEKVNEAFITRAEAAKFLKITLPTLNQYTKLGIVTGRRFGSRVLYRKEDLVNSGKKINIKNQKRDY